MSAPPLLLFFEGDERAPKMELLRFGPGAPPEGGELGLLPVIVLRARFTYRHLIGSSCRRNLLQKEKYTVDALEQMKASTPIQTATEINGETQKRER
jgi:hypothetical protein